jgi:hypothetical protein
MRWMPSASRTSAIWKSISAIRSLVGTPLRIELRTGKNPFAKTAAKNKRFFAGTPCKKQNRYSGLEAPFSWRAVSAKMFDFIDFSLSHVLEIKRFASTSNTTT